MLNGDIHRALTGINFDSFVGIAIEAVIGFHQLRQRLIVLVGFHLGFKDRLINRERGVGPDVQVVEDFVPAIGFVFGFNQAHGAHRPGVYQRVLRRAFGQLNR